jgi:hypothetical protein
VHHQATVSSARLEELKLERSPAKRKGTTSLAEQVTLLQSIHGMPRITHAFPGRRIPFICAAAAPDHGGCRYDQLQRSSPFILTNPAPSIPKLSTTSLQVVQSCKGRSNSN